MRVRALLVVCVVLTIGAVYGRYQFLRDRGRLTPDTTFLDYVLRREPAKRIEEKPAEQPKPDEGRKDAEKDKAPPAEEKAPPKPPPKQKRPDGVAAKAADPDAGDALARARGALEAGKFDACLAALEGASGAKADELRHHAAFLRAMVSDVPVDPGAGRAKIIEVKLENGNILYAVQAKRTGGTWDIKLADGIGCGLAEADVAHVAEVSAETFHRERLAELQGRLRDLGTGGVFDRWKAIRLAWRRGFAGEVYRTFQDLAAKPKAVEALELVLSVEKGLTLPRLEPPSAPAVAIAEAETTPAASVPATEPEAKPPEATARPGDDVALRAIDGKIKEARAKIRAALNEEGPRADQLKKEAGRLLGAAQQELADGSTGQPMSEAYAQRMHLVTLLLDDFLKLSGFGLGGKE